MTDYRYHLGIYSKLIRGNTPDGPIKPGVEAKLIGHTVGFPEKYQQLCTTSLFFPENPPITKIDARCMKGGAFVYAPVFLEDKHLSVFSRIEARPERGKGQGGRKFTHCAALIVEDKWEPGLIQWAARMLFTKQYGGQCWGDAIYENKTDSKALDTPPLSRGSLPNSDYNYKYRNLKGLEDLAQISKIGLPAPALEEDRDEVPGQVDVADWLAVEMEDSGGETNQPGFAVQGRFLSFASGTSDDINGPGDGGFFISLDTRKQEDIAMNAPLSFNDAEPPYYVKSNIDTKSAFIVPWRRLKGYDQRLHGRVPNTLSTDNFWPDQISDIPTQSDPIPTRVRPEPEMHRMDVGAPQGQVVVSEGYRDLVEGVRKEIGEQGGFQEASPTQEYQPSVAEPVRASPIAPIVAENARRAPQFKYDFEWPKLLKYKDHPAHDIYPVSRDMFEEIAWLFDQLCKRLSLIDEAPFDQYPSNEKIDGFLALSFRQLLELVIDFSASGSDPNALREDLVMLFSHASLPGIGVDTSRGSSLLRQMFVIVLDKVGHAELVSTVSEIARRERKLADYYSAREGQKIQVDVPNEGDVSRFFNWLLEPVEFDADDPVFEEMQDVWWDAGLSQYFEDLEPISKDFFFEEQ